jgi:fucose permease
MVIMGTIGAGVLPAVIAPRRLEKRQLFVTTVGTTILCVTVALISSYYVVMVAMALGGFLLIGALPTILDLADRSAKGATGIASGLVWLAGNGGGLIIALIVQVLVKSPFMSFMFLAIMTFVAIFLVTPLGQKSSEKKLPAKP